MSKPPQTSTTIQDIARKLGLSAMTVSRALRNGSYVSDKTRQKVLQAARELRYRPNRWARSLVTKKSFIIGIVIPDISHAFFAEITLGVEETLDGQGYDLLLCHSRGSADRERAELDMLVGSRVDGLIVASEQPEDSPETFAELQQHELPFVLIDRFFPRFKCPCVRVDDRAVGRMATEQLLDLGHTRIAHIQGPRVSTASLRRQGYLEALGARGLAMNSDWIVSGDFHVDGGREAMKKLLLLDPRPTAVFAANDPSANGAVAACKEAGVRVPSKISIIGAGDIEGASHPNPFLSTVDWPHLELGRTAAKMLLTMISTGRAPRPRSKVFSPQLLLRQSTAPVA